MKKETDFGQFITEHRIRKSLRCVELAEKLGISTAYLSQLEHGVRLNPEPMLIIKAAEILEMNAEDSEKFYDSFAESANTLPPDITRYLMNNKKAQLAIRAAYKYNAADVEWQDFIDRLKK